MSGAPIESLLLSLPPQRRLDPFPYYKQMRLEHPIRTFTDNNFYAVYRYDAVRQVLTDSLRFSSDLRNAVPSRIQIGSRPPSLIASDPPRHTCLRRPMTSAFALRSFTALPSYVEEYVNDKLNIAKARGGMDIVRDLAYPLPFEVILRLLQIPEAHKQRFSYWWELWLVRRSHRFSQRTTKISKKSDEYIRELESYLRHALTLRREQPGDDLLSTIATLEVEGSLYSLDEALEYVSVLLIAAHVTTTSLISSMMLCLLEQPAIVAELCATPTSISAAVEETLRYRSPVQAVSRVAMQDTELDGTPIKAHKEILAWIGSANRDEQHFDNPERFDIRRQTNSHLAFGGGHHFCLGATLARLQACTVLAVMLKDLPYMRLAEPLRLEAVTNPFIYGFRRLPIKIVC